MPFARSLLPCQLSCLLLILCCDSMEARLSRHELLSPPNLLGLLLAAAFNQYGTCAFVPVECVKSRLKAHMSSTVQKPLCLLSPLRPCRVVLLPHSPPSPFPKSGHRDIPHYSSRPQVNGLFVSLTSYPFNPPPAGRVLTLVH